MTRMTTIEFVLERTVPAPINQVFARLVDIEGHNEWMPKKGTMFKHVRQTSPGEPRVGTTYLEDTTQGPQPGEIVELEAPHTLVYHWWDKSKSGKLKSEGWPGYSLEPAGENSTLVRHQGKLTMYGITRLLAPIYRRLAVRERTVTIDALKASFESSARGRA
jgi:uncharacterized protein YndB with AHSA1/START domain